MTVRKYNAIWSGDEPPAGAVKKAYDAITDKMAVDFEIDIEIIVCHGKKELIPTMDFDKFYIFSMMTPDIVTFERDKIKELVLNGKTWSVEGGQSDILRITGETPKSMEIICDEAGTQIACVFDTSLYFLNDFPHCKNQEQLNRSLETFKYVVDQATKTDELFKALKAGAEVKGKRSLEHTLSKQFKDRLKKEESALSSSIGLYDKYITNVTDAQRKIIATQSIIAAIQNNLNNVPVVLNKKWDSVKKLEGTKMFEVISFQKDYIKGTTTPIYLEHGGKIYNFGKYDIVLKFDGNISIHSLFKDRKVKQDHPHVSEGRPCWGNMNGEPQKRIAESEFDVAFVEIFTFLNHYSKEGGPYANIENWPTISKEEYAAIKTGNTKKVESEPIEEEMTLA